MKNDHTGFRLSSDKPRATRKQLTGAALVASLEQRELSSLLELFPEKFASITDSDVLRAKMKAHKIVPSLAADASPEAFATAMGECQGYAPACSDAGNCRLGNWCFGREGTAYKLVRDELENECKRLRHVYERAWYRIALNALDDHRWLGRKAIHALKLSTINQLVRKKYGAATIKEHRKGFVISKVAEGDF